MDCSYCKKDMGDSDICPHCGMGRRIDYELFKSDKEERKKSFEDYEKDYLDRLEKDDRDEINKINNPDKIPNPDNFKTSTMPNPKGNKGLMIALGLGFPLLLGIITGAIMAAGGGGDVTYVYQPMQPQYGDFAYRP